MRITAPANFYVFDKEDPVVQAYRGAFPKLFKDEAEMPADLRRHVRYPDLLMRTQAEVYELYHMQDVRLFFGREDVWSVAGMGDVPGSESFAAGSANQPPRQTEAESLPIDPYFVLMPLARRKTARRVRDDSAVHALETAQHDRLDGRAQRRRQLRLAPDLQFSEVAACGRPGADKSAHQSGPVFVGAIHFVEPARLQSAARQYAGDSAWAKPCFTSSRSFCRPTKARCPNCV